MSDSSHGDGSGNSQGESAPEALTKDGVIEIVNSAITGRLKAAQKQMADSVSSMLAEALAPVIEKVEALPAAPAKGDGSSGGDSQPDSPELNSMRKQLADLQKQNDTWKQQLAEERQAKRLGNLRTSTLEQLANAGFRDQQRATAAMKILLSDGRVNFESDSSDSVVFRDSDGTSLPLADGLKSFAKSEEGKLFLPPANAGGSGDASGNPGANSQQAGTPDQQLGRNVLQMMAGMRNPVGGSLF